MRCVVGLSLLLWVSGCDDGAGRGPDAGALTGDMRPPPGSVCDLAALAAECPPGSLPIVEEERVRICDVAGEVTDEGGAVTGVCRSREACTFICNFTDPCPCGIDRVTEAGVFCVACETACGDARCEGGEDPVSCPIDCAERCEADVERCNGTHREVCEDTGRWTTLTCRADQRCIFAADPVAQGVTLCETRAVNAGGTFPGLGSWHPVEIADYSAARFPVIDLGVRPIGFAADGQLLAVVPGEQRMQRIDLSDPHAPVHTTLPNALPSPREDDMACTVGAASPWRAPDTRARIKCGISTSGRAPGCSPTSGASRRPSPSSPAWSAAPGPSAPTAGPSRMPSRCPSPAGSSRRSSSGTRRRAGYAPCCAMPSRSSASSRVICRCCSR